MFSRKTALNTSLGIRLSRNHSSGQEMQSMAILMNESVDTPLTMNFADRSCIVEGGKVWVDIEFGNERVYTPLRHINPQMTS